MQTKELMNMNRGDLRKAFDNMIGLERKSGLVDVKFCVGDGGTTEDAMRQLLHIKMMEAEGKTRNFSDY